MYFDEAGREERPKENDQYFERDRPTKGWRTTDMRHGDGKALIDSLDYIFIKNQVFLRSVVVFRWVVGLFPVARAGVPDKVVM